VPELALPVVLVIMGVSGSGKSTVGGLLSDRLGWTFEEGDSLHPAANVEKMAAGIPLTDEDRWPWLAKVADWIDNRLDAGESGIITCSALKRTYRNMLNRRGSGVEFVYLSVGKAELTERVEHRPGHFMPASLLNSQLETLEPPSPSEPAIDVDAGTDPQLVVDRIMRVLGLRAKPVEPAAPVKKAPARNPGAQKTTVQKTTVRKTSATTRSAKTEKSEQPDEAAPRSPRKTRPASPRRTQSPS
jgi:gluconokinase